MKKVILLSSTMILLLALSQASFAQTDTKGQQNHPRREEVNNRLKNQNARIKDKVADGKMSRKEAAKLHKEDHQIRQEERDMAAQNHGHITKGEQKVLNHQENHVSRQIHRH